MSHVIEIPKPRTRRQPMTDPQEKVGLARLADAGLLLSFLALCFLLGIFPLKDTDFWWHLKTGDIFRQTGQLPKVDTYTFGAEGHKWVDLHWIFQFLISYGYEKVGIPGLNLVKCVINCLAVGLLVTAKKREWPIWVMLMAWIPALLVLSGRMYVRPETLTLLYLSAYLAILVRIDERPRLAFVLPFIQIAWVNSQGLFVFGPGLFVFALVASALQPRSFAHGRSHWWRLILIAFGLVCGACLINPYGLQGALYPLQLVGTMSNPIFRDTIAELEPLNKFMAKTGFTNGPLQMQFLVIAIGFLSFFAPILWRVFDRTRKPILEAVLPVDSKKAKKPRRKQDEPATPSFPVGPLVFRSILFIVFTALSWQASRNSHQLAAVVGAVSAWNFGEWAAEVARSRQARGKTPSPAVGRLVSFGAIAGVFVLVASGGYYAWAGEGRTIGLGEERLWFPHEAVAFAGRADMPSRSICFHNGHSALYEYQYAPERKTYTDARLEVMGPEVYTNYIKLDDKLGHNVTGWEEELDAMGRPLILVDNVHTYEVGTNATLLASKRYRCVWFDPIAAIYVHEAYKGAIEAHAIDFAAVHFGERSTRSDDLTAEIMEAKTAWNIAFSLSPGSSAVTRPGWRELTSKLVWKGLDHAREIRRLDPSATEGWKWAGMLETYRDPPSAGEPVPRFRMNFDPVFDLSHVRGSYLFRQALARSPDDGNALGTLSHLDIQRGLFESALPLFDRFLSRTASSPQERSSQAKAEAQRAKVVEELGLPPESLVWANLSELDRLITKLYQQGRAATAAGVLEAAYPVESRPWEIADRLATIRLHLGEPDRAYQLWTEAKKPPSEALRSARQAVALFARTDFDGARLAYESAIRLDPKLFEAHFGLIVLESDMGRAPQAFNALLAAEKVVPHTPAGSAIDRLRALIEPYLKKP